MVKLTFGAEIEWGVAPRSPAPKGWQAVPDGSLPVGGVEWVSPVVDGAGPIADAFGAGLEAKGKTGLSAGLHIHVGAVGGLTASQACAVARVWTERVGEIAGDHRARFCRPVDASALAAVETESDVVRAIGASTTCLEGSRSAVREGREIPSACKYDPARYRDVNLVAWLVRGAVEIRAFDAPSSADEVRAAVALVDAVVRCALGESDEVEAALEAYLALRTDPSTWEDPRPADRLRAAASQIGLLPYEDAGELAESIRRQLRAGVQDGTVEYWDSQSILSQVDSALYDAAERARELGYDRLTTAEREHPEAVRAVWAYAHLSSFLPGDLYEAEVACGEVWAQARSALQGFQDRWDSASWGAEDFAEIGAPLVIEALALWQASDEDLLVEQYVREALAYAREADEEDRAALAAATGELADYVRESLLLLFATLTERKEGPIHLSVRVTWHLKS